MGEKKPKYENLEPKDENEFPAVWPQWIDLPGNVTANILHRLGIAEIFESAQKVCTTWRGVCRDPAMWRVIHITDNNDCRYSQTTAMYCRAVDLSQGQLVDLTFENHCNDALLHYIVDRSSDLKRLTLQGCHDLTEKSMVEAVKKLPLLEELDLIIMPSVKAADIIDIGTSCTVLKSFTFNQYGFCSPGSKVSSLPSQKKKVSSLVASSINNEYALAIAKSMPNLCHLRLIANSIEEKGLEAILDGCPNLESLDLRQCFRLDLRWALVERYEQQIKHLKFPSDPVSFSEYLRAPRYQAVSFIEYQAAAAAAAAADDDDDDDDGNDRLCSYDDDRCCSDDAYADCDEDYVYDDYNRCYNRIVLHTWYK